VRYHVENGRHMCLHRQTRSRASDYVDVLRGIYCHCFQLPPALNSGLGRPKFESYMHITGTSEIKYDQRHFHRRQCLRFILVCDRGLPKIFGSTENTGYDNYSDSQSGDSAKGALATAFPLVSFRNPLLSRFSEKINPSRKLHWWIVHHAIDCRRE
jgi:hypothetical protein